MEYITGFSTDVGNQKKINQDSLLIKRAHCDKGEILLAMICDGMGGLSQGEVASATVIEAFSFWFDHELQKFLTIPSFELNDIKIPIDRLLKEKNQLLLQYGKENHFNLGTTATGVFLFNDTYFIFHIGDTRIYSIYQKIITQITKDHTWVKSEVDKGIITEEEAKTDPRRNVLLQCIGATTHITPDYYQGVLNHNEMLLICSDGFRHVVSDNEFISYLENCETREDINNQLYNLIELNKKRNELDNITALMIKVKEGL